jgi:hypothetical protein
MTKRSYLFSCVVGSRLKSRIFPPVKFKILYGELGTRVRFEQMFLYERNCSLMTPGRLDDAGLHQKFTDVI